MSPSPRPLRLDDLASWPLPELDEDGDKERRGAVLVVAGGARVPGAPILAGLAALRAGAGKLQLAAPPTAAVSLGMAVPEAAIVVAPVTASGEIDVAASDLLSSVAERCDAVVIGPGMVEPHAASRLLLRLMQALPDAAFVADAAAVTGLDAETPLARVAGPRLVLTPHAGEMARLTGLAKAEVTADPLAAARRVSERLGAVVVMKGATTYVASPDGGAWRHAGGVVGLGTSGSGDVLAGAIGGFLARGAAPVTAALWGVCVHAEAGHRLTASTGALGFLAREILDEIPRCLARAAQGSCASLPSQR
jgi:hydroxyethylthiazole kinase-like uncharacterized protein yjeF